MSDSTKYQVRTAFTSNQPVSVVQFFNIPRTTVPVTDLHHFTFLDDLIIPIHLALNMNASSQYSIDCDPTLNSSILSIAITVSTLPPKCKGSNKVQAVRQQKVKIYSQSTARAGGESAP